MWIAAITLAVSLTAALSLTAFLVALYIEALRLRPHPQAQAFAYFDARIRPRLKLDEPEGARRFSLVRQALLVLLTADIIWLSASPGLSWITLLEALVIVFAIVGVFGHILPLILITRTSGRWAGAVAPLARVFVWAVEPLILLTAFLNSIAQLGGARAQPAKNGNGNHEIEALLNAGQEEGLIGEEDRKLIQSVVEFGDKTVREVMTPRPQMVVVEADATVEELRRLQIEEEYSRIPVYEGTIDHIIGFVHSRDTLEVDKEARRTLQTRELARPLAFVPETKLIHELMRELQHKNAQMAVVVDEYGQTAGLVTMEDMMEEIVGEIRDESEPDRDVVEYPDQSFVASGNLDLDRLEELVDFRPDEETESTTIGGLVCEQLGQVPNPGAKLRLDGIEIEVLSADDRRVRSVRIRRAEPVETPAGSEAAES